MPAADQFLKLRNAEQPQQSRTQDNVSATLTPIANALNQTPIMGATPPAWIQADLRGGYSQTAAPQPVAAYHKDALGYVWVKAGLTHAAGCAAGTAAFIFAAAYRPAETLTVNGSDAAGLTVAMTVDVSGNFANLAVLAAGTQVRIAFSFRAGP